MCGHPQVNLSGSTVVFSPPLVPEAPDTFISSTSFTFLDVSSIVDQKPWQRFTFPIGQIFNARPVSSLDMYLTLTNLASQLSWDAQRYAIRATCMASAQVGLMRGMCQSQEGIRGSIQGVESGHLICERI